MDIFLQQMEINTRDLPQSRLSPGAAREATRPPLFPPPHPPSPPRSRSGAAGGRKGRGGRLVSLRLGGREPPGWAGGGSAAQRVDDAGGGSAGR